MKETLEHWLELAKQKLQPTGVKCFVSPGNDDRLDIDSVIDASGYAINPAEKCVLVNENHEMISTGWSNPTPFDSPRETTEDDLQKKIDDMAAQVRDMKSCIFNLHCPPYNTGLDLAPKLEMIKGEKLPVSKGMEMVPVGSTAVYAAIQRYQPLLGLHGHIHESEGIYNLGRTLCLNTGSSYPQGILKGIILNLEKEKVKSYFNVSG
jgi:Icc-related predicted phosphoesterase